MTADLFPAVAWRLALIVAANRQQETAATLEYLASLESRLGAVESGVEDLHSETARVAVEADSLFSWARAIGRAGRATRTPLPPVPAKPQRAPARSRARLTVHTGGRSA
jgi:hypothetical protein